VSAKYSTDDNSQGQYWHSDREHIMAQWTDKPFHGVSHRYESVEHRILVEYVHGVGVDITHQVRSEDSDRVPEEWSPVKRIEVREHGARYDKYPRARWFS